MAQMTLTELTTLLRECAGVADGVDLAGDDVLDTTFTDLGYDSLALLQTVGRIEQIHGLTLDEDVITEAETPGRVLDVVNEALSDVQAA
jgi:act minimal PKS acyl carrier protein